MLSDKMEEISKENLLKIIQEENSQINEMADPATLAALAGDRKRRGQGPKAEKLGSKPPANQPIAAPGDDPKYPTVHVNNPFRTHGEEHVWVFLDKKSADELLEDEGWANWFETRVLAVELGIPKDKVTGEPIADYDWKKDSRRIFYGTPQDIHMASKTGGVPAYFRVNTDKQRDALFDKTGIMYPDTKTGERMAPRELLLRQFYRILRQYFGVDSKGNESPVVKHLNLCGLPQIKLPDAKTAGQKRGTDVYSEKENENITFRSIWFLPYETYLEFAEHTQDLLDLQGASPEEYETYEHKKGQNHARKFNTRREQWSANRLQQKMPDSFKDIALTPIHKNERGGYKVKDQDFIVSDYFTFTGKLYDEEGGQKYRWEVSFKTEVGEKLRESSYAPFKEDKDFGTITTETKVFPGGIEYDKTKSILENGSVLRTLLDACQQMKDRIMSYNPTEDLEARMNKMRSDVTKVSGLSESKVKLIVNDVLKQLKK